MLASRGKSECHTRDGWGSPAELTPALRSRVALANGTPRGLGLDPGNSIADPPLKTLMQGGHADFLEVPEGAGLPSVRPTAQAVLGPASLSTSLDVPVLCPAGPEGAGVGGGRPGSGGQGGLPSGSGWP